MNLKLLRKYRRPGPMPPRGEDLRLFHDVARALTSTLDLDTLLRAILSLMEDFFGPDQWSLLMVDEETQELYYALSSGIDLTLLADQRIAFGEGVVGRVAVTGETFIAADIQTDPDWREFRKDNPHLTLKSMVCQPIRHSNRTLGVFQLFNSESDSSDRSQFLRVLCEYAAIAMENSRKVKLIHHLSITDDCTGLYNARYLYTSLETEIAAMQDTDVIAIRPYFSLLFFDLDYFKTVNDTHGHLVGSRLLAEVGSVVKRALGPDHAGFRYGGDEFVALLRGMNKTMAIEASERLQNTLREYAFLSGEGLDLKLTASFGLATYPEDGDDMQAIIRSADTMMYKSKADGRDRISVAVAGVEQKFTPPKSSRHATV